MNVLHVDIRKAGYEENVPVVRDVSFSGNVLDEMVNVILGNRAIYREIRNIFQERINTSMRYDTALLFQFTDKKAAELAADTFKELGYESENHHECGVHVHLHGDDLTSALEIAQSHGGTLANQSPIDDGALMNSAYSLDAIPIPAHIVNEDLIAREEGNDFYRNRDDDAPNPEFFTPDAGTYDHFAGDVHT